MEINNSAIFHCFYLVSQLLLGKEAYTIDVERKILMLLLFSFSLFFCSVTSLSMGKTPKHIFIFLTKSFLKDHHFCFGSMENLKNSFYIIKRLWG
jgi:hypothetical protein